MANESVNKGIVNSWSLVSFAKMKGKMKITSFTNSKTNEQFKSCAFVDDENNVTLCAFSSNLGELTISQIVAQKDDLQVVLLASGTYKLCKLGENSWKNVDLGI